MTLVAHHHGRSLDVEALARERFGHAALMSGQREVIERLLAGRSAAAIFPTGGGKSLCYQLPALVLDGVTLIVSPLIALMKDQIDALRARGVLAHRLDSSLPWQEQRAALDDVKQGRAKLLYVAPERFHNERFRAWLAGIEIGLFAVDEAHCISEWGHNFRPEYLKLAGHARAAGARRILALTATATRAVVDDIRRGFSIEASDVVRTPFYRPNLALLMTPVSSRERDAALERALAERPIGATLVYVSLQKTAEAVAARLSAQGRDARAYHAGLDDDVRAAVQEWFQRSRDGVVVATIAFGMGVDKPDIRYVYHYNMPKSLESLAQEIGRAGRDGRESTCQVFVSADDVGVLESFAYGDTPDLVAIERFVAAVLDRGDELELGLTTLSRAVDVRPLVLRTLLTYLELDGYLEAGTPVYGSYRFQPLCSSKEMLARFDDERRRFLTAVLRAGKMAKKWVHLEVAAAAAAARCDRQRVVRALDWLAEAGLIELDVADVRHRYRRLARPADKSALARDLFERVLARERAEIARLDEVLKLAAHDECQVRALGERFGDPPQDPCGHCSWCLGGRRAVAVPPRTRRPVDDVLVTRALHVLGEHGAPSPRRLARFLCGLASPAMSAAVRRHELFGALDDAAFTDVLAACEAVVGRGE